MRINILDFNRQHSPSSWVHTILKDAKSCSDGAVEQQFIGAVLERRFKGLVILNHAAQVGNHQTTKAGDFQISRVIYHVTATPSRNVVEKCAENIKAELRPVLLVPAEQENKARLLAQEDGIDKVLSLIAIEIFVAITITNLAISDGKDAFDVLSEIVKIYHERLTDDVGSTPSLKHTYDRQL